MTNYILKRFQSSILQMALFFSISIFFLNSLDSFIVSTCFLTKAVEEIQSVKVYPNFKENRLRITKDEKKVGVYCLVNLINGHTYIGSSNNIASRMRNYLNNAFLNRIKNSNMPISKALLKYGQNNFAVLIVEYVDSSELTTRETYFISQLLPYYNVLKQGYSSTGYKHTEATKKALSDLGKNRVHTDNTKALLSTASMGENNPFYNKTHSVKSKLSMIVANSAHPVYIYNCRKELLTVFPSVMTLAKLINSNHATIVSNIKNTQLFRGGWYFSSVAINQSDSPVIPDWTSVESNNLTLEIKNSSHIRKAVFVHNLNKEFVQKFDGVIKAVR